MKVDHDTPQPNSTYLERDRGKFQIRLRTTRITATRKLNLSLLLDMAFCDGETTADLKAQKMDWPTQQPFLQQDNLGLRQHACLFVCVQCHNLLAEAIHV
jgi:hypothetical protein